MSVMFFALIGEVHTQIQTELSMVQIQRDVGALKMVLSVSELLIAVHVNSVLLRKVNRSFVLSNFLFMCSSTL